MGSFIRTTCPLIYITSLAVFWWNIKSSRWLSSTTLRFGAPWFLAFPKTKITFEREETLDHWWDAGKYDRAADSNWENCPKVPTFKGTEATLSYVHCFLCLVSPSINVSIFHITWLDTFRTEFICCVPIYMYIIKSGYFLLLIGLVSLY